MWGVKSAPPLRNIMSKEQDFYQLEKNILLLKKEITDLEISEDPSRESKIADLRGQIAAEWALISPHLTATQIVQIARHPQAALHPGLYRQPGRGLYRDARRPAFRRRPGYRRRLGFYKGRTTAFIGHQKGRTHKGKDRPELRPAQPRRLPQGAPDDEDWPKNSASRSSP